MSVSFMVVSFTSKLGKGEIFQDTKCKTYMKTSVLALIDTEKPVGNSTNYMELESNISVHENSYLVSLRMWTPLDLDHLVHICWQIWTPFVPPKKTVLFGFASIMWDSELKGCKGNLMMLLEYFQVI